MSYSLRQFFDIIYIQILLYKNYFTLFVFELKVSKIAYDCDQCILMHNFHLPFSRLLSYSLYSMSRGYPINRRRSYNTSNSSHLRKLGHQTTYSSLNSRNSESVVRDHNMSSYLADDENYPSFKSQLLKLGLELRDIPPDGNCLFRALGDQLDGSSEQHATHRQQVCDYITKYRSDFEPFIEDDVPFDSHIRNLRQTGTYGGNEVIVAFCRLHGVNVVIHQLGRDPWQICDVEAKHSQEAQRRRQLHIAYHNGDHYSSVRALGDKLDRPSNIRIPFDPTNAHNAGQKASAELEERVFRRVDGAVSRAEVARALDEVDYDEDAAVEYLLALHEAAAAVATNTNNNSASRGGLWSPGGTAHTIFGPLPNTDRRPKRASKLAKKERATERRRTDRLAQDGATLAARAASRQSDEFIVQGVHAIQI